MFESHSDTGLPAKVGDGIGDLKRFVLFPSGVRIGVQHLTRLHFLCDPVNANDVSGGRLPDLDLELSKALITVLGYPFCHGGGIRPRHDLI